VQNDFTHEFLLSLKAAWCHPIAFVQAGEANQAIRHIIDAATIDIVANTPEEFARYIESEYAKRAQVVKASGARVE
jgi:tripartite-type tricarboxylate transporter receptor subunit TctC